MSSGYPKAAILKSSCSSCVEPAPNLAGLCRILSASCLMAGPFTEPTSSFPTLLCMHPTSLTQMGQFRLFAHHCLGVSVHTCRYYLLSSIVFGLVFQKSLGYSEAQGVDGKKAEKKSDYFELERI